MFMVAGEPKGSGQSQLRHCNVRGGCRPVEVQAFCDGDNLGKHYGYLNEACWLLEVGGSATLSVTDSSRGQVAVMAPVSATRH